MNPSKPLIGAVVETPRTASREKEPSSVEAAERNQLRQIVASTYPDKLRFVTAERWRAYLAILWLLLERRRAHEIEVYYDDLLAAAMEVVPSVQPGSYDPDLFRADVKQLELWGNIAPLRLEARRIESLADRKLQKFLCRADDETVLVLEFLQGRSHAAASVLSDRGRHLLRDAAERLDEAVRVARKLHTALASEGAKTPDDEQLVRLQYLCLEADHKVDDAAKELAAFDAALISFTNSPFRLEALADVVERLERYVEDYIAEATKHGQTIQRAARNLLKPGPKEILARAHFVTSRRVREDPLASPSSSPVPNPKIVAERLERFFAPNGRFEILLERVHASARDVVRRVHAHLESVRGRNLRIETLRDRTREMARLHSVQVEAANAWINQLFASAHVVTDLRAGTPDSRAPPPRPARRYEISRTVHRGGYLTPKTSKPEQARALERARLLSLDRFVEERILRGRQRARLRDGDIRGILDLRMLIDAIKAHTMRPAKARRSISYRIERTSESTRARFLLADGLLDAPNHIFARKLREGIDDA